MNGLERTQCANGAIVSRLFPAADGGIGLANGEPSVEGGEGLAVYGGEVKRPGEGRRRGAGPRRQSVSCTARIASAIVPAHFAAFSGVRIRSFLTSNSTQGRPRFSPWTGMA